jgi:hypothetical protein
VDSFTPWLFNPEEKIPQYPLDRKLGMGSRASLDALEKRKIS